MGLTTVLIRIQRIEVNHTKMHFYQSCRLSSSESLESLGFPSGRRGWSVRLGAWLLSWHCTWDWSLLSSRCRGSNIPRGRRNDCENRTQRPLCWCPPCKLGICLGKVFLCLAATKGLCSWTLMWIVQLTRHEKELLKSIPRKIKISNRTTRSILGTVCLTKYT